MIKKIIVFVFGLMLCNSSVFAEDRIDCLNREGHKEHDAYWESNSYKQVDTEEFRTLSPQKQKEAKTRNLCFGASLSWHTFCGWTKCEDSNRKIWNHTLKEYCEWAKIDCFSDDIEKIVSTLQDSGDTVYEMFNVNMDDVTQDIKNDTIQKEVLDIDPSMCYRTDSNGDTVWHTFIKNNKSPYAWENMCISLLKDDDFTKLKDALYKTKNKAGKTAVQEAVNKNTTTDLLEVLSWYYKQEKLNCNELASDISKYNDISIDEAKKLIRQCF